MCASLITDVLPLIQTVATPRQQGVPGTMGMHVATHGRKRMFEIFVLMVTLIAAYAYWYKWLTSTRILSFDGKGRPFNASLLPYLTALAREPNDQNEKLSNWEPMFVTATSENHFRELRGMVHSMQSKYPGARFVVYDLGLTVQQVRDTTWVPNLILTG